MLCPCCKPVTSERNADVMKCISGLLAAAVVAVASSAVAGDFTSYHVGNSLTEDLRGWNSNMGFRKLARDYVEAQAPSKYSWGEHIRYGNPLNNIYANPGTYTYTKLGYDHGPTVTNAASAQWNNALSGNHWDLVTFQPYPALDGNGNNTSGSTLATDTSTINNWINLTRSRPDNSTTRFYIYAAWPRLPERANATLTSNSSAYLNTTPRDYTDGQYSALSRVYWHALADRVRQTNPSVSVIPVGEVFNALDVKMQAGEFENPLLASALDLHRDRSHTNAVGENVAAWTAYATVFKDNPYDMPFIYSDNTANNGYSTGPTTLSDNDRHLIQTTIWEVVTSNSDYTNVPEPASLAILGIGGMLLMRRQGCHR